MNLCFIFIAPGLLILLCHGHLWNINMLWEILNFVDIWPICQFRDEGQESIQLCKCRVTPISSRLELPDSGSTHKSKGRPLTWPLFFKYFHFVFLLQRKADIYRWKSGMNLSKNCFIFWKKVLKSSSEKEKKSLKILTNCFISVKDCIGSKW